MARNLRKTLKRRRTTSKRIKGGEGQCKDGCDANTPFKSLLGGGKASYSAGGGKRRKVKSRRHYKKSKNIKRKTRKTGKKSRKYRKGSIKGGSFMGSINEMINGTQHHHGYSMWASAGPLESQGTALTKNVLNARTYEAGNPMDQPIEQKYGDHNTPKV
tara:strand:+ start:125 stop:601 length:477 start_codon:yes stop_codon:yes gene_type:complete